MTTLVCWCGRDSRAPSSLYVATDSRISWGQGGRHWDSGRKLVVRTGRSEVLAFAGDVTLAQGALLGIPDVEIDDALLHERLIRLSKDYPTPNDLFGTALVFARRIGDGMSCAFSVTSYEYLGGRWNVVEHAIPATHSDVVCVYGTGAPNARAQVGRWIDEDVSGRTSRSVFSGFCDALRSGDDPRTGGVPQLAGMFRKGPAQEFGIVWDNSIFLAGTPAVRGSDLEAFEWRNDLFERCDPRTMLRTADAQPHSRPYALRRRSAVTDAIEPWSGRTAQSERRR